MTTRTQRLGRLATASPKAKGITVLVILLLFTLVAFNRPRVETTLAGGEMLNAEFSRAYKLAPYQSVVKLAGVQVGMVVAVDDAENGSVVQMKLDDGILEKLGTAPRANIRPTLVLGGKYYVELVREGQAGQPAAGSTIPVKRTSVPVELDRVLSAVTPDAAHSIGGTVQSLDATFDEPGRKATQRLLDDGPATLRGTKQVLAGLRGNRPEDDLTGVVVGLQNTAAALNREPGQWRGILDDLATTSAALADSARPLAAAIDDGPATLTQTQAGLADLDGTLERLEETARSFRPSARELAPLLADLDPVLVRARPVLADARAVARDARPVVQDLVPTSVDATALLDDVSGPVLERLSGPVTKAVLSPWHGSGVYQGGGNDHRLYEETGYLLANFADVFKYHDKNGAMGRLMAGVGLSTPGGILGYSLEEILEGSGLRLPAGPQEGANEGEPAPPLGSAPPYVDRSGGSSGLPDLALPLVTEGDK
ncbi:MlaD family protein [Nocardioides daeguensis]|uniref:Mce/MlaD domain-containing protein n=1 Tax=Nocardioides daeguensis TaxID=908359 RepID=A0ABP6V0F6_9ACTN|nr:MlaD family protein [Nocardioides daeguensis]MBV6728786.1 MCE family protein [Nocardioides daeguensis]MCR1773604.1 MCE family protein [Nocardioides daeguensis]